MRRVHGVAGRSVYGALAAAVTRAHRAAAPGGLAAHHTRMAKVSVVSPVPAVAARSFPRRACLRGRQPCQRAARKNERAVHKNGVRLPKVRSAAAPTWCSLLVPKGWRRWDFQESRVGDATAVVQHQATDGAEAGGAGGGALTRGFGQGRGPGRRASLADAAPRLVQNRSQCQLIKLKQ